MDKHMCAICGTESEKMICNRCRTYVALPTSTRRLWYDFNYASDDNQTVSVPTLNPTKPFLATLNGEINRLIDRGCVVGQILLDKIASKELVKLTPNFEIKQSTEHSVIQLMGYETHLNMPIIPNILILYVDVDLEGSIRCQEIYL